MYSSRKFDLIRRGGGTSSIISSTGLLTTEWVEEQFEVTSTIISNRTLLLSHIPITNSEIVILNGLVLVNNSNWDYTISNNVITLSENLELYDDPDHPMTDFFVVKYEKLTT